MNMAMKANEFEAVGMVAKGLADSLKELKNRGRVRNYTDYMKMTMI